MNDLETRLRDELGSRAEDARAWSSTGASVRQVHHERRVRRRRNVPPPGGGSAQQPLDFRGFGRRVG